MSRRVWDREILPGKGVPGDRRAIHYVGARWFVASVVAACVGLHSTSPEVAPGASVGWGQNHAGQATPPPSDDAAPGRDASPARAATAVDAKPPAVRDRLLDAHNELRAKHCAPPLAWSESLAAAAQQWADALAARGCRLEHSASGYGENLAAETLGRGDPAELVQRWYAEAARYDFRKPGFSTKTGHFTQLVWVGTRSLGCGRAQCAEKEVWVCNYEPAGNVRGRFPENVQPATCDR